MTNGTVAVLNHNPEPWTFAWDRFWPWPGPQDLAGPMNFGHVPGFIAAQLLGAAAAAGVCAVLFSPSAAHAVRELR